jgi:hypothetical protein
MSINSNPTASQENMKKLPISKIFPFIAGVAELVINPYFQISLRIFVKI